MNSMFTPRVVKNQLSGSEVECRGKQHDVLYFCTFFFNIYEGKRYIN